MGPTETHPWYSQIQYSYSPGGTLIPSLVALISVPPDPNGSTSDPYEPVRQPLRLKVTPVPIRPDFGPDPIRAQHINQRMHVELGRSLRLVVDACKNRLRLDFSTLEQQCTALEAGTTFAPTAFAFYFDAVFALIENDEERATNSMQRLAQEKALAAGQAIGALDSSTRGLCYKNRMSDSMRSDLSLHTPDPETTSAFVKRYQAAMDLLDQAAPRLAGEIRAIVHEVVGVTGGPNDKGEFHGGSHYQLWGALFLNAALHTDRIEMVEVLAHESAHSLLFGFCTHEPLTLNEDSELFDSPLRADPRPMDGIYHATYVSARMHWAMQQLLQSELLAEEERERARRALERDRDNFEAGYQVVDAHGVLTDLGSNLMSNARAYIDATHQ